MQRDLIDTALDEDLGQGDLTARFFVPNSATLHASVVARESCVVSGLSVASEVFLRVDPKLLVECLVAEGVFVQAGQRVIQVSGPARSILSAERTALNFIQQLSGVATLTSRFVEEVKGTGVKILDTRKTVPGLRTLQKAAVVAGGGFNHRMGLWDMVLLKDNHWAFQSQLGGLSDAVTNFRSENPGIRVGVEADTLEQALLAFSIPGVDQVLLDNMPPSLLRECVSKCPPHIQLEASGGICLDNARELAETGVHFLSIGALTHSARAIDFSLDSGVGESA